MGWFAIAVSGRQFGRPGRRGLPAFHRDGRLQNVPVGGGPAVTCLVPRLPK